MHLLTVLAFAFLFWQAEEPGRWRLVSDDDVYWTLLVVLGQPLILGVAGLLAARRASRLLTRYPETPQTAHQFHHRATATLRAAACAGFGASVFLTRWPDWFAFGRITPALQIVGDLIVFVPFVAGVITLCLASFSVERSFHGDGDRDGAADPQEARGFTFGAYLDFHLRHHVLIVAIPMTFILFAADMTRGYEATIKEWVGWAQAPDVVLGLVAAGVFAFAPVMLGRIWRTAPLGPGPVRERLEALCRRIRLRYREILVWKTDGLMINAAVMGMFAPVRYVLLSDALLSSMDVRQIEAVFGHEAGHVRHGHMQHFLVFAYVGWLLVWGVMALSARTVGLHDSTAQASFMMVEGIGIGAIVVFWGVGFGWLSRRFERQADLFAARCVTPPAGDCQMPCGVHPEDDATVADDGRVCATGVTVFASALDRVAILNGIPHEERSWRHSSIASRIRFLMSLAGDPARVGRFERAVRRAKVALLAVAIAGSAASACYWAAGA